MNLLRKILLVFLFLVCFQTAKAGWVKQEANTLAWLHDVYFINENKGWIAGSGGTLLATADGGKVWKKIINFTEDNIRQVYFTDENNGWLLCERNIYNRGANSPSYLLKTSDGGKSWETINFTGNGRERIVKIFFNKNGFGLAVGEAGALSALQNDKKTWKKSPSPMRYLLLDGVFTDDSHGAIVGAGGTILFTEDTGLSWNPATVSGKSDAKLNSLFFINQKTGWTVGTNGKIYQTLNGGKFWREQNSTISLNLTDVFFNTTSEGWAVGDEGTILHTTTAGNVWASENTKSKHKLEKVFFIGEKGWIVGFGGTILNYDTTKINNFSTKPQLKQRS
ncbi:MAG: WD40/YVTN/BNR-like repeat-containing protein [Pyrinomonadaceae bacterium]